MFDRCRGWRRKLSRRAEGTLPLKEWGALEKHLARCVRCQAAARADDVLYAILAIQPDLQNRQEAESFDDRVLAALQSQPMPLAGVQPASARFWRMVRSSSFPSPFLTQLAGGGLIAVSVTALCLLPALHPSSGHVRPPQDPFAASATTAARAGQMPVPLESLLQSPTPRAALLWSHPGRGRPLPPTNLPALPPGRPIPAPEIRPAAPANKQHRGNLPRTTVLS